MWVALLLAPILAAVAVVASVYTLLAVGAMLGSSETLLWWAGWKSDDLPPSAKPAPGRTAAATPKGAYLVFLSGAGVVDPRWLDQKETDFLDLLQERLPHAAVIRDIFPYSPTNNSLLGRDRWTRLWAYAQRARRDWNRSQLQWLAIHLSQIRNVIQVGISADRRYGPLYGYGVARVIVERLLRTGYQMGSRSPVVLVALSGGGQIAVGCVPMLREILGRPVWLVSVGSVLTDDPAILDVEHVYHLSGSRDGIQNVGVLLYPGLWPIFPNSAANRARKSGRVTVIEAGPMRHLKRGDYLSRSARLPDGQRYVDHTLDIIADIIARIEVAANTSPKGVPAL